MYLQGKFLVDMYVPGVYIICSFSVSSLILVSYSKLLLGFQPTE